MCENCNYSVSYVEGRRGQYNLKIISAWHHFIYSFNNGFVNHAKIYPGLIWMVCYGAGLQLDSIGEPSCTGNPTGLVGPWAWSEHTSMSLDRLRRLHRRSTEIQCRRPESFFHRAWTSVTKKELTRPRAPSSCCSQYFRVENPNDQMIPVKKHVATLGRKNSLLIGRGFIQFDMIRLTL